MARWHRTLKRSVEFAGVGLHSGQQTHIRVSPPAISASTDAPCITFRHEKLSHLPPIRVAPGAIDASKSMLCTQLGAVDSSWWVSTVEHLMAALAAARVTCVDVNIVESGASGMVEVPILDGSSLPFATGIHQAGIEEWTGIEPPTFLRVSRPVQVLKQDKAAWLLPAPTTIQDHASPTLHLSVQVNFGHKGLGSRVVQFTMDQDADRNLDRFINDVAPARTFTFEDEIAWMQANNLALGGSLENAVVFNSKQPPATEAPQVLNPDGLRFHDEWVRHKLLDCIGDLALVGVPIHGYFFATSPGHALTHELIATFLKDPANYTIE